MAYLEQEFISYMHEVKKSNNPGAYVNTLLNIEKLLVVDIDAEFDKDECESLYNRLQTLRKEPKRIGKNENVVKQYASNLKRYIEFKVWQKRGHNVQENPVNEKMNYQLIELLSYRPEEPFIVAAFENYEDARMFRTFKVEELARLLFSNFLNNYMEKNVEEADVSLKNFDSMYSQAKEEAEKRFILEEI